MLAAPSHGMGPRARWQVSVVPCDSNGGKEKAQEAECEQDVRGGREREQVRSQRGMKQSRG